MRIRKIALALISMGALGVFGLTPAGAAGATNCAVAGTVGISPVGHVLGGGFNGNFVFGADAVLVCAGTVSGTASIAATGQFHNGFPPGVTTIDNAHFDTLPSATFLNVLTQTPTTCHGDFTGTAVGVAASINLTNVNCDGAIAGGFGQGEAVFSPTPTGVAVCGGGPEPIGPDADLCLSQVAVAANFTLAGA